MARFDYHKPSDHALYLILEVRDAYKKLEEVLDTYVPNSREKSVAFTELETSAFWAIKAVTHNDPNGEVAPAAPYTPPKRSGGYP